MSGLLHLDAERVYAALPWEGAVSALAEALRSGLDPTTQPARTATPVASGELLSMPAEHGDAAGLKMVSVAPGNAALGLPRIQGVYLLLDAQTLTLRATLDGAALTTLRTPALAAVAVDALAAPDAHRLVVFGAGPQAEGHVHAVRAVRPIQRVSVVSRSRANAEGLVARLAAQRIDAHVGEPSDVAGADVIAAATSSSTPVFDGALVPDSAVVTAVGSHHPTARELDATLMARATVVVEDAPTALREAGDVVMAIDEGVLEGRRLVPIAAVVSDPEHPARPARRSGPAVFKSVGQGWQDLVVARAAYAALT